MVDLNFIRSFFVEVVLLEISLGFIVSLLGLNVIKKIYVNFNNLWR